MAGRIRPSDKVVQANIKKWGIPQPEKEYTVVIHCTTYNHGKYIKDALEGFVMQKCSYTFCAIIIDDCSTDNNAEIIREYAEKYPDIIKPILLGENHMQHGILRDPYFEKWHQSAKYIAQCEGDDYWIDPLKLQKQVDFLEEHGDYGLVYTNFKVRYGNDLVTSRTKGYTDFSHIVLESVIGTPTTCYRTDLYMDYCREFPLSERDGWLLGDAPLWIYIAYRAKVHYIDESLAVYRELSESASHSKDVEKAVRFIDNSYEIRKYMVLRLIHSSKKRTELLKDLFNRRNVLSKVRLCSHRGYAKLAIEIYMRYWKNLSFMTKIMCLLYIFYGLLKPVNR